MERGPYSLAVVSDVDTGKVTVVWNCLKPRPFLFKVVVCRFSTPPSPTKEPNNLHGPCSNLFPHSLPRWSVCMSSSAYINIMNLDIGSHHCIGSECVDSQRDSIKEILDSVFVTIFINLHHWTKRVQQFMYCSNMSHQTQLVSIWLLFVKYIQTQLV